jgi:hypothetical protein
MQKELQKEAKVKKIRDVNNIKAANKRHDHRKEVRKQKQMARV